MMWLSSFSLVCVFRQVCLKIHCHPSCPKRSWYNFDQVCSKWMNFWILCMSWSSFLVVWSCLAHLRTAAPSQDASLSNSWWKNKFADVECVSINERRYATSICYINVPHWLNYPSNLRDLYWFAKYCWYAWFYSLVRYVSSGSPPRQRAQHCWWRLWQAMVTIESHSYSLSLSVKYRPLHTDLYHRHLPNVTSLYWQLKTAVPQNSCLAYVGIRKQMQPILRFSTRTYNFEHQKNSSDVVMFCLPRMEPEIPDAPNYGQILREEDT